jgi:hypothetical protein
MAEVRYLRPEERVPSDGNRLVIRKTEGGQYTTHAYLGVGIAELGFGVENTLRQALVAARGQAERLQISTIFVMGATAAERS